MDTNREYPRASESEICTVQVVVRSGETRQQKPKKKSNTEKKSHGKRHEHSISARIHTELHKRPIGFIRNIETNNYYNQSGSSLNMFSLSVLSLSCTNEILYSPFIALCWHESFASLSPLLSASFAAPSNALSLCVCRIDGAASLQFLWLLYFSTVYACLSCEVGQSMMI